MVLDSSSSRLLDGAYYLLFSAAQIENVPVMRSLYIQQPPRYAHRRKVGAQHHGYVIKRLRMEYPRKDEKGILS